jgi:NMD protein affecting ribosome stability and mRNA decay
MEEAMEAAGKSMLQCECGRLTNLSCEGCGMPVCSRCAVRQIGTQDRKNLVYKHYCPHCIEEAHRNPWEPLYWKKIMTL